MLFDWDENKRKKTLLERGVDFVDAMRIWRDPSRQERVDRRVEYSETRIQTIGRAKFGILFVVYTLRTREDGLMVNRIISARLAKSKEREQYENRSFSLGRVDHDQ